MSWNLIRRKAVDKRMREAMAASTAAFEAAERAINNSLDSMNEFRSSIEVGAEQVRVAAETRAAAHRGEIIEENAREAMDLYEDVSANLSMYDPTTSSPTQFVSTNTVLPPTIISSIPSGNVVTVGGSTTNLIPPNNVYPFYCSQCYTWFTTNEALMTHMHHPPIHPTPTPPYYCKLCGVVLASIELGVQHIIDNHVPKKSTDIPPMKLKNTLRRPDRRDIIPDEFSYEDDE